MYLVPLFLSKDFIGLKIPSLNDLTLNRYEPTTINIMPIKPLVFGNSPIVIGDVINKKRGVKLNIGTTREISPFEIARWYNIAAAVLIIPETNSAIKNSSENFSSIKNSVGVKRRRGIKLLNQEINKGWTFLDAFLLNTFLNESEIGFNIANRIHIIFNRYYRVA